MKTSWSTLRSMFISGSSRRPDQSFFFISQASNGMNSFSLRQTENIQILHWPRKSPFIKACAIANVMNFQPLVDFFNLPGLNIIQFLSFFRGFAFLTERRKKSLCFLYFPLWPVHHFQDSQRRACALRGVSGRVYLETRKTNVRRAGERV